MSGLSRTGVAVAGLVGSVLTGMAIAAPSDESAPPSIDEAGHAARVMTFGHSYVAGLGASKPSKAWPSLVAASTCRTHVNQAGSGDISAETENRVLMADDTIRRTDVAVIETGINDVRLFGPDGDLLNRYGNHVRDMLTHLRTAHGAIPVVVVADPGISGSAWAKYPPYDKGSQALADEYAQRLAQVAAEFPNVSVVDVRRDWTPDDIHADGVHPNDAGHALIADAVSATLRSRDLSRCQPVTDIDIVGPAVIDEPYGAARFAAEFAPERSWHQAMWSVTSPDGSHTDVATIDDEGVLRVNDRTGDVVVTATAADGGGTSATKLVHIEPDPDLLRGNAMNWPGTSISVSSEYSDAFAAAMLRDGTVSGEWASAGEQNPWLQVTWDQPIRADRIVLYDRAGIDDAHGGTLTFDDGSTVDVADIPTNGDAKVVTFGMRTLSSVRFQVEGGTGPNVGLAEFEVYAVPSAPGPPTQVSATAGPASASVSWAPPTFDGGAPVTGYVVTPYHDGTALDPITVARDARQAVVSDLTAGEPYTFTVTAINMVDSGPESQPSNEVRPG